MFRKILIANGGEIACRVIRTAVYGDIRSCCFSEQDSKALHVSMADEAICIGPAPANESYLLTGQILAMRNWCRCGSRAMDFYRKPTFASAVEKAGLTFIGPSEDAIATMGDKDPIKKISKQRSVSTVPRWGITRTTKRP